MKTMYKVVGTNNKELVSAIIKGKHQMTYRPGEWTKRKYWGPMVFERLDEARSFIRQNAKVRRLEIWECEVHRARKVTSLPYASVFEEASCGGWRKLLKQMKDPGYVYWNCKELHSAPGTFVVEEVKLTRFVE